MSTLTIRNVSDALHERLKERAERNRRSLNAEVLLLLEQALYLFPEEAELRERFVQGEYDRSAGRTGVHASNPLDAESVASLLLERRAHLRALGVRRVGMFGSVVRGEAEEDSDVDLLVQFEAGEKSYDRFLALATYLEDLLGRRVDLITTEGLSPYIGPRILEEARFVTIGT